MKQLERISKATVEEKMKSGTKTLREQFMIKMRKSRNVTKPLKMFKKPFKGMPKPQLVLCRKLFIF